MHPLRTRSEPSASRGIFRLHNEWRSVENACYARGVGETMLATGTQIGKYVIKQLLGEGGMGTVYAAEHVMLRTKVALKVLLPRWTSEMAVVNRFINEARAAAALKCVNIVQVHDIDSTFDGRWYFAMELLEGGTLAEYLHTRPGAVPATQALRFACGIASALQAAHENGIIHRDLKPDNIALAHREHDELRPIVLDFGVAKLNSELGGGFSTRTGAVVGTPVYMAPEQLHGDPVGPAADVWSLAAILYEMLTGGYLPFQQESRLEYVGLPITELWYRQRSQAPIDPRRHAPELPEAIARVALRGLGFDARSRQPSPRELVLELAEVVTGDAYEEAGLKIVERYAPHFLRSGAHSPTFQLPAAAPPPTATPILLPGRPSSQSLGGKYVIGDKLGTGGMAEVYRAKKRGAEGFSVDIAVKRVLPGYGDNRDFAAMFIKEAQIASRLSHPNIVNVFDFDEDPEHRLFLAMEYVDGPNLSNVMERGAIPIGVALFVVGEVLRALDYAHKLPNEATNTRGIIHRDVSPQNVLLSYTGAVKLGDFGIAKAREASDRSDSHMVKGKPAYMSPEQVNAERLDGRSDLFAIGVVLWEMLAGKRLFVGSAKEMFAQILTRNALAPSTTGATVSPELDAVVLKLLARDRDLRYATAEDARKELAECPDWPRDGSGELVRLLAKRFPIEVRDRARGVTDSAATSNERPRVAGQLTVPLPIPSTLGSVASQSVPTVTPPSSRWRWAIAVMLACGVGGGAGAAVFFAKRANEAEISPRIEATAARPTRTDPATVPGLIVAPPDAGATALTAPPTDADIARAVTDAPSRASVDASTSQVAAKLDAGTTTVAIAAPTSPRHRDNTLPVHADDPSPHAIGTLTVTMADSWATVYVDNVLSGQTPFHMEKIPIGRHRIRLKNDQHDKTLIVDVKATGETAVETTW